MPKLIAVTAVTLVRESERIEVKPGQAFDFTAEELKDIEKSSSPEVQIVRKPVNETADVEDSGDEPDAADKPATKPATKTAAKTAAKKASDDL